MTYRPYRLPRRPPLDHQFESKFSCPTCGAKPGEWCKPLNGGDMVGRTIGANERHRKRFVRFCNDQKRKFK